MHIFECICTYLAWRRRWWCRYALTHACVCVFEYKVGGIKLILVYVMCACGVGITQASLKADRTQRTESLCLEPRGARSPKCRGRSLCTHPVRLHRCAAASEAAATSGEMYLKRRRFEELGTAYHMEASVASRRTVAKIARAQARELAYLPESIAYISLSMRVLLDQACLIQQRATSRRLGEIKHRPRNAHDVGRGIQFTRASLRHPLFPAAASFAAPYRLGT